MMFYLFDDETKYYDPAKGNRQYRRKWSEGYQVDDHRGDCERCPECGKAISLLQWIEPRKIRLTSGKYPDRLSHWLHEKLVVSERFVECYQAEGLTGITAFQPIEIVKAAGKNANPPKYFRAEIAYTKKVRVDPEKTILSGSKSESLYCALCNPFGSTCSALHKLVLNLDDTSDDKLYDIFQVYSIGVVMSQKFYDCVKKYDLTNFDLISSEEYTWHTTILGYPRTD